MKRNQILGQLFEIFILKLVLMSGYKLIGFNDIDPDKVRMTRRNFIEFKGRGAYHQIDIPVDLIYRPSFIYPIRLLGEVKYHSKKISKDFIREEIGKMKDIQENYFVNNALTSEMRAKRRLEVFAFFSASGFNESAERLAYAHGIKTISYENNKCVKDIVRFIRPLSKTISAFSNERQEEAIDRFFNLLIFGTADEILFETLHPAKELKRLPLSIRTSIIGTTITGLTIHFISNDRFPNELFRNRDYVNCRVRSSNSLDKWQLEVNGSDFVMYFSMPEIIKQESFSVDGNVVYPRKETELDVIYFDRFIDQKQRRLEFRFDHNWFRSLTKQRMG